MRRKREAFDPTADLFEGLPSAKHAAIRLRDDSGDSDSSHADADGAASEANVEPAADSVPVAETAARLSAREPSAASSAQGVTDEAGLPLWMRTAAARIIGDHTPPISALALDRRLEAALGRMGVRQASSRGGLPVGVERIDARTRRVARARRRDRRPVVELAVRRVRGRRPSRVVAHRARRRRGTKAAPRGRAVVARRGTERLRLAHPRRTALTMSKPTTTISLKMFHRLVRHPFVV